MTSETCDKCPGYRSCQVYNDFPYIVSSQFACAARIREIELLKTLKDIARLGPSCPSDEEESSDVLRYAVRIAKKALKA